MGSHLSTLVDDSAMNNMSRETMIGVLLAIPCFLRYFQLYMEHYYNETSSSKLIDSNTASLQSTFGAVTSLDDSYTLAEYDEEAPPQQQQEHQEQQQVVIVKATHKSLFTGTIPINSILPPSDQSVSTIPTSNASSAVLRQRQITAAAAAQDEEDAKLDLELQPNHVSSSPSIPPDFVTVLSEDQRCMTAITPMKQVHVDLEQQQPQSLSPLSISSKQLQEQPRRSERAPVKSVSVVTPKGDTTTSKSTATAEFSAPKIHKNRKSTSNSRRSRSRRGRPPMETISVVTPATVDSSTESFSASATTATTTTTSVPEHDDEQDESVNHHHPDMSSTAHYLDSISRRLAKKARHANHSDMVGIAQAMVELGDILMQEEQTKLHRNDVENKKQQDHHYQTALKVYKRAEVVQKAIIEDTMASVAAAMAQQSTLLMEDGHVELANMYRDMAAELIASPTPKHLKRSIDLHHDHRDQFMDRNQVHHTSLVRKLDRRLKRASAEAIPLITTLKVQGHIASLLREELNEKTTK